MRGSARPPADGAASIGVDHEGEVDEARLLPTALIPDRYAPIHASRWM
jgi:hypothetical protein